MSSENNTSLWQFIKNVGHHWVALMSGGILIVSLGLFERFSGKNVPVEVYIAIIALIFCIAFYLAWRDERNSIIAIQKTIEDKEKVVSDKDKIISETEQTISELKLALLQEKEARTPQLKAAILEVATAELSGKGEKQTAVTYKITLSNLGMPSVAVDWMPFVTLAGRKPLGFELMHFENELTLGYEGEKAIAIRSQDMIYEKTTTPIQTGAMVVGYLHFWSSYKKDEIRAQDTILGVFFKDVKEIIYEVHFDNDNSKTLPAPMYTPGVKTRATTINKPASRPKKRK